MAALRLDMSDRPLGLIVGSLGTWEDLQAAVLTPRAVASACDWVEIRLDRMPAAALDQRPWQNLGPMPILFTARRGDEGGDRDLSAADRQRLLDSVLDDATCLDIELASVPEFAHWLPVLAERQIPWIGSFHDFNGLPETALLEKQLARAKAAGATAFKVAAFLKDPASLARLAEFQATDHGIPVASMGMGPLAAVSRLLCAQCGSVLNYGFLGNTPTAPGQWSAQTMRQAFTQLNPWRDPTPRPDSPA